VLKRVLVGFDGSMSAARAFMVALDLAEPANAELLVLAVAQTPDPAITVGRTSLLECAKARSKEHFVSLRKQAEMRGLCIETKTVLGEAAEELLRTAAEMGADLIVIGHRSKTRVQRWLSGSVSKRVITCASCPVLIVK
jgi:nucleotide-binding universal stress UspA family protein